MTRKDMSAAHLELALWTKRNFPLRKNHNSHRDCEDDGEDDVDGQHFNGAVQKPSTGTFQEARVGGAGRGAALRH